MKKFIIQNAYVIDGSGTPAFPADVLIEDGTIKAIGKQDPQQAGMVIDAPRTHPGARIHKFQQPRRHDG